MQGYTTTTWGYKLLSNSHINFYHVLLPTIGISQLPIIVPQAKQIQKHKDGSITITLSPHASIQNALKVLISFFERKSSQYIDTPYYSYTIPTVLQPHLAQWLLSIEGCLALSLLAHPKVKQLLKRDWSYINAPVGGLYLAPYTLHFYENHLKVIHPTTVSNKENRRLIERTATQMLQTMVKKMAEAQPNHEGLALLSFTEEKATLAKDAIVGTIEEKSAGVVTPHLSGLLSVV